MWIFLIVVFVVYIVMMFLERHYFSGFGVGRPGLGDAQHYQVPWWTYLQNHGFHGILTINTPESGLGDVVGNYTTIWYFPIALLTKFHLATLNFVVYSIKTMAVLG